MEWLIANRGISVKSKRYTFRAQPALQLALRLHFSELQDDLRHADRDQRRLLQAVSDACASHRGGLPPGIGDWSGYCIKYHIAMSAIDTMQARHSSELELVLNMGVLPEFIVAFTSTVVHTVGLPEVLHSARRQRTKYDFSSFIREMCHQLLRLHAHILSKSHSQTRSPDQSASDSAISRSADDESHSCVGSQDSDFWDWYGSLTPDEQDSFDVGQ